MSHSAQRITIETAHADVTSHADDGQPSGKAAELAEAVKALQTELADLRKLLRAATVQSVIAPQAKPNF